MEANSIAAGAAPSRPSTYADGGWWILPDGARIPVMDHQCHIDVLPDNMSGKAVRIRAGKTWSDRKAYLDIEFMGPLTAVQERAVIYLIDDAHAAGATIEIDGNASLNVRRALWKE